MRPPSFPRALALVLPFCLVAVSVTAPGAVAADAEERVDIVIAGAEMAYTGRYAPGTAERFLGHEATVTVDVTGAQGNLTLDAEYRVNGSALPARVTRADDGSFRIGVDLAVAGAASEPTAVPGAPRTLHVTARDEGTGRVLATRALNVTLASAAFDVPGALVPVRALPLGLSRVGGSDLAAFHAHPVHPDAPLGLRVDAGLPGVPVQVTAVSAHGSVTRSVIASADGVAHVTIRLGDALGDAPAGLVVLAAHAARADGGNLTFSKGVVVLPVTATPARVSGVTVTDGNVTVRVTEDSGVTRAGALAFLKGPRVLALAPAARAADVATARVVARVPADAVRAAEPGGQYAIAAFLTDREGAFRAFASATRGLRVHAEDLDVTLTEQAGFTVRVVNLNDNGDDARDPGLEATVHVRVTGLPGPEPDATSEITLREADSGGLVFPLGVPREEGEFPVTVHAVLGELALVVHALVTVAPATSALQDALSRTPAPGFATAPVLALAALGLALARARFTRE